MKINFDIITSGKLIVLLLLIGSLFPMYSVHSAKSTPDELSPITGRIHPQIDGFISSSVQDDYLDEWADAKSDTMQFIGKTGTLSVDSISKVVRDTFYLALRFGDDISSTNLGSVVFQLDRDNSGDISKGDIKVEMRRYGAGLKGITDEQMDIENVFSIYLDSWTEISDRDSDGIPVTLDWAEIALATSYNTRSNYMFNIEFELNLFQIEQDISYLPSQRQTHDNIVKEGIEQLSYGLVLAGAGFSFGYPVAPEEETYSVSSTTVAIYDVIRYYDPENIWIDEIFVTQATQNAADDAHILRAKDTLVRILLGHDTGLLVGVIVKVSIYKDLFLTRRIAFQSKSFSVPPVAKIQRQNDTVNFTFSANQMNYSTVIIKAEIISYSARIDDADASDNIKFKVQHLEVNNPVNIYLTRINTGTRSMPNLPNPNGVDEMLAYTRALLPTNKVNFIWLPDTYYPNEDSGGIKSILNSQYNSLMRTRMETISSTHEPFPFPHQLIGIRPNGFSGVGGSSDPHWPTWSNWFGGNARVAWIALSNGGGSSGMMHEINHNFGPSSWGHHISGHGYGCGAAGTDGDWDTLYGDNIIHDIGWMRGAGVVSPFTPEIMTYCSAVDKPYTWIGEYRWNLWFDHIRTIETDVVTSRLLSLDSISHTYRQISGSIGEGGLIELDPSFEFDTGIQTRFEDLSSITPNATVKVYYRNGSFADFPILSTFSDVEGNKESNFHFNFQILDDHQVTSITLLDNKGQKVSFHDKSETLFAGLEYPTIVKSGETINFKWWIQGNSSNVFTKLQYSQDGRGYITLPDYMLNEGVSLDNLPGGLSKFRLLVSDGVNTTSFEGGQITVGHSAPIINFQEKLLGNSTDPWYINATEGNNFGISLTAQNEVKGNIHTFQFTIHDKLSGLVIRSYQSSDVYPKFSLPQGNYILVASVVDPTTGLSNTASIDVVIHAANIAQLKLGELNDFHNLLNTKRSNYETDTTNLSISHTTSDENSIALNPLPLNIFMVGIGIFVASIFKKRRLLK